MTAVHQLRALVAMRWRMVRSSRVRKGMLGLLAGVLLLIVAAVVTGRLLPHELAAQAVLLSPTGFAGFALLALVAPLSAGGGNELFPAEQLVSYPVRPATTFLGSLVVAPLNLAWLSQVLLLTTLTGAATGRVAGLPLALLTTYAYVLLVTVVGQALAWAVVGTRQTRAGRLVVWSLAICLAIAAVAVVRLGYAIRVLDGLPTKRVLGAVLQGGNGAYLEWARGFLVLLVLTVAGGLLGTRACGWALRRPSRGKRRADRAVGRRRMARSALAALVATDRASVWRTPALRRGALILILLPGAATAGLGIAWDSLVLLPGLVAAGAGLLFGVNAFCLDASGGLWLAAMPHRPALAALSKALVLVETCLLSVASVIAAGAIRAESAPTAGQVTAICASALCCTLWVAATCMRLSTTRPHRADLGGVRDTPAPPGSMAVYSARLAVGTTLIGVLMSTGAYSGLWQWSLVFAVPLALLSVRSLVRSVRLFEVPTVRAIVVQTVATG